MAVSAEMYGLYHKNAAMKLITDLNDAGTAVKVALCTVTYSPNQDTHNDFADITNEVVGAGYAAGGATLTTKAVTYASRVTKFDADDVEWTESTITARYAIVYDSEPVAEGDECLICWIDFGEDKSSVDGTFKITFAGGGIFTTTVAAV